MNLEQVARRAKVSTATVSRVLNNASVVKSTTRARVVKAIEELKYHPNLHARSLAGGKSRTIGVIASNMENPFFFDIYKTIESDAHTRGYEVVMANTDYRSEQLVTSVRLMIGRRVAGLAVIVSEMAVRRRPARGAGCSPRPSCRRTRSRTACFRTSARSSL